MIFAIGRTKTWRTTLALAAVGIVFLLAEIRCACGENWPQWRGSLGTGVSTEKNLPLVWSESRSLLWKCPLPAWGASTPIIWKDALFVTGQTEQGQLVLLRIDTPSGKIIWQREVGQAEIPREGAKRVEQHFHDLHNLASPSPVTDGQYVVAHFGDGTLAAFQMDGTELWKKNLQTDYGKYTNWYGHSNSPVLYRNLVISVCMQDSLSDLGDQKPAVSYLVAHDVFSGRERWFTERATKAPAEQADAYTTPLLLNVRDRRQLIVMGANQLDAYDPADGKQLWFLPNLVGGRTVTGVTTNNDMLFATRGLRGATFGVKYDPTAQGEIARRQLVWERQDSSPDSASPVVWGELLFTVTDDGFARCLHATTGNTRWKHRVPGKYKASPLAADGRIYFLNEEGVCTVVSAAPYYDKLVENKLEDEFLASPAVSEGTIYLRGKRSLYAIRK